MDDDSILDDAAQLECLLPTLLRRPYTLDPVSEVPVAQRQVCSILPSGARSMSSLSDELCISVSAVTQIADRLEKAGMVERISEPDDRRMKILQLTEVGQEIMRRRRENRVKRISLDLAHLSPAVRASIL